MTRFSPGFIYPKRNAIRNLQYQNFTIVNNLTSATQTFGPFSFGPAAADRWVYVIINSHNATARTINSVTIGGVTATPSGAPVGGHTGLSWCIPYFALVPAGTTGNVVVVWSGTFTAGTANGSIVDVWTVNGEPGFPTLIVDTLDDYSTTSPVAKNFTMPAGGLGFVTGSSNNVNATTTGGFTQDDGRAYSAGHGRTVWHYDNTAGLLNSINWTATNWSASAVLCPKLGRTYGITP